MNQNNKNVGRGVIQHPRNNKEISVPRPIVGKNIREQMILHGLIAPASQSLSSAR